MFCDGERRAGAVGDCGFGSLGTRAQRDGFGERQAVACRRGLRLFAALACFATAGVGAGAPAPVLFRSAPGRFEVAAVDGSAGGLVNAMADEGWRLLATPLALPDAFSSSILVRLIPAAEWSERAPFRVFVEAGGLVSVRIRWDAAPDQWMIRRALVQALLMRQGVAFHSVVAQLTAPLWLELGSVGWWHSRVDGARLDALKYETARLPPPALAELLGWQRGAAEPPAFNLGSVWLLSFLQSESAGAEWRALLRRLLAGDEPLAAVRNTYPGRFNDEAEAELWWQTGWHHLRRAHVLPVLTAAESRLALEPLARFVVLGETGADVVAPIREVLSHASDLWVDLELQRRTTELNRLVAMLHPFYRNAGLSLTLALAARGPAAQRDQLCQAFENDWHDARELEAESTAALDRLERPRGVH